MYRASIELGRISKFMKLKFNLIIKNTSNLKNRVYENGIIDKFTYGDSEYLKLSPKPYITIDISDASDKNDSWNSNTQVNFNKFCLFELIQKTKSMLESFKIKELFYKKDGKLQVNPTVASQCSEIIRTPNKAVKMIHAVIYDNENKEIEYEGICFMINSPDNYCCLTYHELEYLYYELNNINMHELSISLINVYLLSLLCEEKTQEDIKEITFNKVVQEVKEDEITEKQLPKIQNANEVPEI